MPPSSARNCKYPLQKSELQGLLADLALQLGDPVPFPAQPLLPLAREDVTLAPERNSRRQRCRTLAFTSNARAASRQ